MSPEAMEIWESEDGGDLMDAMLGQKKMDEKDWATLERLKSLDKLKANMATSLKSYTAQELKECLLRIRETAEKASRLQAELVAKEKADRERANFELSGSDRKADDPKQGRLF